MSFVRWSERRRRAKVRPGTPGSTQSSSTMSGRESRTSASAAGTSPAHITLYPALCRLAARRSRTAASSSTTSIEPPMELLRLLRGGSILCRGGGTGISPPPYLTVVSHWPAVVAYRQATRTFVLCARDLLRHWQPG